MSAIKIRGFIISIIENKKLKIEITDEDSLEKMNKLIKKLKKNKMYKFPIDKSYSNIFYITINYKTGFDIRNIEYNHLSDLCGIEVFITFNYKYYKFKQPNKDCGCTSDCTCNTKKIFYMGYYFLAFKVINTLILD